MVSDRTEKEYEQFFHTMHTSEDNDIRGQLWTKAFENVLTNPYFNPDTLTMSKLDMLLEKEYASLRLEKLEEEDKEEELSQLDITCSNLELQNE